MADASLLILHPSLEFGSFSGKRPPDVSLIRKTGGRYKVRTCGPTRVKGGSTRFQEPLSLLMFPNICLSLNTSVY